MNSDKCRTHRPVQRTSAFFWGDNVLRDFQSGRTGGSETADGRASGRRSTGRKEKRHQDNGRKPKCAKFHHNHSCRCERKAIKGCTARIVSDHSAFRKRKSDRRCICLRVNLMGDRPVTRAPFISFCRCRVATKNGRIPPREVLWNLNFGSPVRVTRTFGGLQNH